MSGWNERKGWFELTGTKAHYWHRHCAQRTDAHIAAVLAGADLKAVERGSWWAVTYAGDPAKLTEHEGLSYLGPVGSLICAALADSCEALAANKRYVPEWRWPAAGR